MDPPRPVFFISDGTGITAETIGHSLLTQFSGVDFNTLRIPFVDTREKALAAVQEIRAAGARAGLRPIVVNSVVDPELNALIIDSGALMLDIFAPFIQPLEQELGTKRQPRMGQAHGMVDFAAYEARINATNYALTHDDGIDLDYAEADLILVGVSRSGKTPTCLYLALHYGVKAANYPLTEDDLESENLPRTPAGAPAQAVRPDHRSGATAQIRNERKPGSRYAKLEQCKQGSGAGRGDVPPGALAVVEHDAYLDRGDRQQGAGAVRHPEAHVLTLRVRFASLSGPVHRC